MSKRTFGYLILILVVAGGLYYFTQDSTTTSQSQQQAQQVEGEQQEQSMSADTMPAPEQPTIKEASKDTQTNNNGTVTADNDTITKDTMPTPPPVNQEFAPGRALIEATILSVETTDGQPSQISVRVDEVLGYGHSTPPIAPETEFTFDIRQYLGNNPQYSSMIQQQAVITMLIASQRGMRPNTSDQAQPWGLVELKQ